MDGHRYTGLRPRINNLGYIVWSGWDGRDKEIYLYNGSTTTNISDNCNRDIFPEINNMGEIVWIGDDGTGNREVFLVRISDDADGDGVPDDMDECPTEDATGLDADGDGCIDSFDGLTDIIDTLVEAGVIDEQMRNSLISKIENANNSADRDNICAAVNQLEALKNQINAQRDKKISDEAADLLIDYADNLIAQLLSQLEPGDTC